MQVPVIHYPEMPDMPEFCPFLAQNFCLNFCRTCKIILLRSTFLMLFKIKKSIKLAKKVVLTFEKVDLSENAQLLSKSSILW